MRVDWRALTALVDSVVDRQWGERIEIVPWRQSTYGAGVADTTRPVTQTVGELFFTTTRFSAQGDTLKSLGDGFAGEISEGDIRMSVPRPPVDASGAKQGDRVRALDRSGEESLFQIARTYPDGVGRVILHLTRVIGT